ncbi:hypothetical protein F5Y18DRAFT_422894 [Xylariaceae sp. FL1019]|nr:hypothetical protein F5Y18DRAFT_422894 [Xylariaceae sp. FL1019]
MRFAFATVFALAGPLVGAQYCYDGGQRGDPFDLDRASDIACSTVLASHYNTGDRKDACINGVSDAIKNFNWHIFVDFEGLMANGDKRQIDLSHDDCKEFIHKTWFFCSNLHGGQSIYDDFYFTVDPNKGSCPT